MPHKIQKDIYESGVRKVTKQTAVEQVALTIESEEIIKSVERKIIKEIIS